MDAYCVQCGEVRSHHLLDEGSCECTVCGHVEELFRPLSDEPA